MRTRTCNFWPEPQQRPSAMFHLDPSKCIFLCTHKVSSYFISLYISYFPWCTRAVWFCSIVNWRMNPNKPLSHWQEKETATWGKKNLFTNNSEGKGGRKKRKKQQPEHQQLVLRDWEGLWLHNNRISCIIAAAWEVIQCLPFSSLRKQINKQQKSF